MAWTSKEKVKIHLTSINNKVTEFPSPYLTFFKKQRFSIYNFLTDITCVSPVTLLLASPNAAKNSNSAEIFIKDVNFDRNQTNSEFIVS